MVSQQRKRELRRRFDTDRLRPLLRVAVDGVMAVEAAGASLLDLRKPRPAPLPPGSVTAVIKTFQRPRQVRRLVRSIRRVQPDLPILVVDDNETPSPVKGADLLAMPYNSGISAGRNAALEQIDTPFFLLLDDDFVFTRRTAVAPAVEFLLAHPDVDIVGGRVVNMPDFSSHDYSRIVLGVGPGIDAVPVGTPLHGLPVYAKVANFFVGRTDTVRAVGWAEDLKVMEHQEFFSRAWGTLTTVYDDGFAVLHARNPFDRASPERRENMASASVGLSQRRRGAGAG